MDNYTCQVSKLIGKVHAELLLCDFKSLIVSDSRLSKKQKIDIQFLINMGSFFEASRVFASVGSQKSADLLMNIVKNESEAA